jgi:hypothetical protein
MSATGPGQSLLLLLDVVAHLEKQGIAYAVVGALAASVYGTVRATTDADALVSVSRKKIAALEKSLRKAGLEADLRFGASDDPIPSMLAISDRFAGTMLRIIGREDFIAMKCFAGGPRLMSSRPC